MKSDTYSKYHKYAYKSKAKSIYSSYNLGDKIYYNGREYIILDDEDAEYPNTYRCRPVDLVDPNDFDDPDSGITVEDIYIDCYSIKCATNTGNISAKPNVGIENYSNVENVIGEIVQNDGKSIIQLFAPYIEESSLYGGDNYIFHAKLKSGTPIRIYLVKTI